ncbi:hypothetical protein MGI18_24305 [Bacillus sp. OVS6]|nr:hypothetical protein MGI18_24305 [Bacillus sp. OVS6]
MFNKLQVKITLFLALIIIAALSAVQIFSHFYLQSEMHEDAKRNGTGIIQQLKSNIELSLSDYEKSLIRFGKDNQLVRLLSEEGNEADVSQQFQTFLETNKQVSLIYAGSEKIAVHSAFGRTS